MPQLLYTKQFGEIEVEKSWVNGAHHVARLTNGAYVHITGLPINSKGELEAVLPGEELEKSLKWFDHRHDDEEQAKAKKIVFDKDGFPYFEDGSPVKSPSELVQALNPGPVLDAALMALSRKLDQDKKVAAVVEKQKAGKVAKGMKKRPAAGPKQAAGEAAAPALPAAPQPEGRTITV